MKKRNVLNSPRLLELKKGRRRIILNKILFFIFVFLAIFAGLAFISRISSLNISGVEIIGSKVIDTEAIKKVVEEQITGNYLWFFQKTNILFYPKNNIKDKLHSEFKRLKNISFFIKDGKILEVSITEREAKYIWCGENLPSIEAKPEDYVCSFMDTSGYVFDMAPYFSGDVYFKFFGPLFGDYFSPEIFEKVVTFKDTLTNMDLRPVSLYIKNEEDVEIYLSSNILPPDSPKIIFKKDFDLEKLSLNLQTALDTEPLKSNLKNKRSSLLYIDLRFGNKVYYKFR